jgi:hypothetical protein
MFFVLDVDPNNQTAVRRHSFSNAFSIESYDTKSSNLLQISLGACVISGEVGFFSISLKKFLLLQSLDQLCRI